MWSSAMCAGIVGCEGECDALVAELGSRALDVVGSLFETLLLNMLL